MSKRILVIEDDDDIAHLLELHLKDLSFQVEIIADGELGLQKGVEEKFDLIILDLMLPGMDGLEVCRRLRNRPVYTPILMLTAKSSELDRVLGLELGADDYLTKPFSLKELQARVKAILRRIELATTMPGMHDGDNTIVVNDLVIEQSSRRVSIAGNEVVLTATEFDLLLHFAKNPGRVYNRTQLLDSVWGYGHDGYEHTVNSHINRLRKIENDPAHADYILTVWGIGYKFIESHSRQLS